ncbi:MAG: hypothetical protein PHC61_16575, partial [Chitinivibrionales bacterium]|nr:hypothetical protein [Chitinivibrionales bacterium]
MADLTMIFLPPLLALAVVRDAARRRFCGAVLLWTLAYSFFAAISTSARAPLMALAFAAMCAAIFFETIVRAAPQIYSMRITPLFRQGVIAVLVLMGMLFLWRDGAGIMRWRRHEQNFARINEFIAGVGVTRVTELFTTDFDLYIRGIPPYIPYFNGGCPRWGTYCYNEEYPEFAVDSPGAFAADCRKRGVRFVILNEPAHLLSPALGNLYDGKILSADFALGKKIDDFRIFEVLPVSETVQ